ncbi:MAG: MBL fold metallo-hydrolase [Acidobacteriales bacterium]|nr:MBL fold metallo-hydrolase [Terriglobales bacterium]
MRLLLHLIFCASLAAAQDRDWSKVEIKVQPVSGGIYMLTGSGGNIGISVGEDGVLIVDDQFAPLAPRIQEAIKHITEKPIRFVLNTHYHYDHTGGNPEFGKDSTIIAHDNVRKRLVSGSPSGITKADPAPKAALPVITFDSSLTVHINGEDIQALHFAHGHTDGDSIIFFPKANVVHMGDDFVTYGLPFVDVEGGGNLQGMIENVEKAMASVPDDVKVIPGHGPLSTKADVKKFTDMLKDCIALVKTAMRGGKTLAQVKAAKPLQKYDAIGQGFIKTNEFIELIYNELKGDIGKAKQRSTKHH